MNRQLYLYNDGVVASVKDSNSATYKAFHYHIAPFHIVTGPFYLHTPSSRSEGGGCSGWSAQALDTKTLFYYIYIYRHCT